MDPAIEKPRRLQPGRIRIVGEDHAATAHGVDDLPRDRLADRRASPAAAKPSVRFRHAGIDVRRAVHHDGALAGVGVEARFQAVEAERVAVMADVGVGRAEQADARFAAFRHIRKARGHVVAAVAAMRHELVEEHLPRVQVEYPEARGRGRQRVIDQGEGRRRLEVTGCDAAGHRAQREVERVGADACLQRHRAIEPEAGRADGRAGGHGRLRGRRASRGRGLGAERHTGGTDEHRERSRNETLVHQLF